MPALTSTKSLTGHSQGATGVQEMIYTIIMMIYDLFIFDVFQES